MKKKLDSIWRKHGRQAALRICSDIDMRGGSPQSSRLKTSLTFESAHQAYCWSTDRGRSRLIKH